MSSRNQLLESITNIIQDYRKGEIPAPTPRHVEKWISQFDNSVELPLLTEIEHILGKTYFSKETVKGFFAHQITNEEFAGTNPCEFWKNINFLNIQQNGNSQKDILELFAEDLSTQCANIKLDECGSNNNLYIYLDDGLFSGNRIRNDLSAWIKNKAPQKATVHTLVIVAHQFGEWQCKESLKECAEESGKQINFTFWAALRPENRRKYRNNSEILWPSELPNNEALADYIKQTQGFAFETRSPLSESKESIFTSQEGRKLVEKELLLAGVKILANCKTHKTSLRPLGFSPFGLGFGSTFVTYRNCPNNCPLAFWWGDSHPTSKATNWYPLFPRKTYD